MAVTLRTNYGAFPQNPIYEGKERKNKTETVALKFFSEPKAISHYVISAEKYNDLNRNSNLFMVVGSVGAVLGSIGVGISLYYGGSIAIPFQSVGIGVLLLGRGLGAKMTLGELQKND